MKIKTKIINIMDDKKFEIEKPDLLKLLELNFPAFIIQKVIGISLITLNTWLRKLRKSGEFQGRLPSIKQSEKSLFEVYCKLEANHLKSYDPLKKLSPFMREEIQKLLKKHFNIDGLILYLDGVCDSMHCYSIVKFDSNVDENYKNFLLDIYPTISSPNIEINFWIGERILDNYCKKVSNGAVFLPDNLVNLPDYISLIKKDMVGDILDSARKYLAPTIGLEIVPFVDKALDDLREKNKLVLQKYYGLLGFEKISIKEIAKEFGVSRTSIDQKKQYGIRKFKHKFDTSIFQSVSNCLSKTFDLQKKHKKELSDLTKKWVYDFNKMKAFYTGMGSVSNFSSEDVKFLITPVKNLEKEFSLRLYHCLTYEFDRIYEVLQTDKEKLLWIRKFGKKSLDELESWVRSKGFELEIKFSEEEIIQFEGLVVMEEN